MPGLLGEASSRKFGHGITINAKNLASPPSAELERRSEMPSDCSDKQNVVIFSRSLVEHTSSLGLERPSCQSGQTESKVPLQELTSDFSTDWMVLDDPEFSEVHKPDNSADCHEDSALVHGQHCQTSLNTASNETLNSVVNCKNILEPVGSSTYSSTYDAVLSDRIIESDHGYSQDGEYNDEVDDCSNENQDMITVSDNTDLTGCIDRSCSRVRCNIYHNESLVDVSVPLHCDVHYECGGPHTEPSCVVSHEVDLELLNSKTETAFYSFGSIVGQPCGKSSVTDISQESMEAEEMGASSQPDLSENSTQRQRSLEPDPAQTKQFLVKSKSSRHLQRSKSYPHMTQRSLFTPIRPSPEQSGLFTSMESNTAADVQRLGSSIEEVARHGDPANDQSFLDSIGKRHTRQQQSNPPVARVNPLANLNPSLAQQQYLQQEQLKDQIQHHHLYCQHLFALQPGYFMHDASTSCQQAFIPVVLVTDPVGGYYVTPDYMPDHVLPASHGHEHVLQYLVSDSENQSRTSSQPRSLQNKQSHEVLPAISHASPCVQAHTRHEPHRSPKRATCPNSDSTTLRGSTFDSIHKPSTSQSCFKRKHKTPLLPDPLIPKFSELASLAANSCQISSSLISHHATEEYQQQPYYFQPFGSNALHVSPANSSVFLQQVPFTTSSFTPAGMVTASPQPSTCNMTIAYQHSGPANGNISRNTDSSGSSDVDFVMNQSGLEIHESQHCPHEGSPFPAVSPTSPATHTLPQSEIQHDPDLTPNNTPHDGHVGHQYSRGMIYIPDGSGSYLAVDAATIQAHLESIAYQGYQPEEHRPYLLTSPKSQVIPNEDITQELPAEAVDLDNSPATVRMVSSNGPPVPMPMQVPPGHMVQQIVDEHGILTHVILSPQPQGPGGHIPVGPFGGPASGSQYYTSYGGPHYAHSAPQYSHRPHPHSLPPHVHGGMSHIQSQSSSNCTNHAPLQTPGEYGSSPPLNARDERTLRMRNRVRKKLQQRRVTLNEGFYPGTRPQTGRRNRVNDDVGLHGEPVLTHGHSSLSENGPLDVEEENSLLIQCLSSMPSPKVTDIEARSSLIQLSPPDCDCIEVDLDPYEIKYELLLSDKGRDAKYKTVFCGDASEITLKDLKPATEYHLKVCAMLTEELKGTLAEPVSFQTLPCEPDTPQPPKLISKTRTSLLLKWNATSENGSKITAYSLECDQGQSVGRFCEVYAGLQRQFKVSQLNASTRYSFRLAAINNIGKSAFSEDIAFFTSGSVPSQPDPPMLSEQFVYALTISWIRRPNDDEFLLQMEDETTGHGFITVYNGPNLSSVIRNLRRNMEYKFRLCAKNEEGQSKWSDAICYKTQPDRPHPPSKPQIKGKMSPYSFRVTWDPPQDTGGSDITKYILELDNGQGYDTVYEGCEREHQFDQLLPGTLYHIHVACCSSTGGRSDFSPACVATTLPIIPGQCQAPKLQGKPKATSLHLRWSYPDYDGGSQVTQFSAQMISPDNSTREVYKGHDRDCIVAGLLPGRPYLFQVRAFNRVGAGPWSEPLEVVSGAGVPDAPRTPLVACRSAHSALVTWEEPFNNGASISEYRLEWQQQIDTSEFSQIYLGPNLFYEAKGLTAATAYTFRVQAINSAGPGLFSPLASWMTPASNPSPVVTVKVKASATSALVSWSEPNCNGSEISSYNIAINDKPAVTLGPVTEHLLDDLQPETAYKIRIQAINSVGVGAYSSALKFTTKAQPPSPPRLECVLLAPCSIKLKWGDGRNSDHLTYTLEMEKDDGSFQAVYTGPAHTHKVTRLTELTSYEFRIFASNDAGSGPYSDTYTFTTTKSPPPPLKAPRVMNLTLHGCLLDWQGVKPIGGDNMTYVLQLLCVSDRDAEYKQIYKGSNTQYQLDSLLSNHEYQVRVAAVRLSSDSSGDVTGAFSPGVIFSPHAAEPLRAALHPAVGQEERQEEKKPWSDQQYAAMILCIFVLLAIVSAFLCQQLISYMSSPEDPASSSASASSTLGSRDSAEA